MGATVQSKEETVPVVDQAYYREVSEVVHSVVRRGAILVQRYAQFICNDLNDRRLKTELRTSIKDTEVGVCLVVELIPDQKCILEAVKEKQFRKLIKRYEKESKKMERKSRHGS
jgi:predicted Rossmann fold nucleotide-binding protein DprA/Smf involved in DNA uptake